MYLEQPAIYQVLETMPKWHGCQPIFMVSHMRMAASTVSSSGATSFFMAAMDASTDLPLVVP